MVLIVQTIEKPLSMGYPENAPMIKTKL